MTSKQTIIGMGIVSLMTITIGSAIVFDINRRAEEVITTIPALQKELEAKNRLIAMQVETIETLRKKGN